MDDRTLTLPARRGRAFTLSKGQTVELINSHGRQVVGLVSGFYSCCPGIQFVPARGTFAMAADSTVRATRSSLSR